MKQKPFMAHVQDGDSHTVAAQLRVLITEAEGGFVAQGLEVDYCASGQSIDEVQDRFAKGFMRTVETLLRVGRPLSALFKSRTPPEIWQEYLDSARQDELTCATIVKLDNKLAPASLLPFQSLAFCSRRDLRVA